MLRFKSVILTVLCGATAAFAQAPAAPDYTITTWHLGGPGRWDYVTVDSQAQRLYVTRSTHTMVIDTTTGKAVADIPGQKGNHGVALAPESNHGFITDGKDASMTVFDLKTNEALGTIQAADDADGAIYDPASKKVLVVCGDAGVMIPIAGEVDPKTGKADPAVELGGKPEFLAADGQGKAFINLEDKDLVAVVDTKTMKVLNKWPVAPGGSPVGMAMDREKHRLFIGCRKPQKMIVMDADSGKVLADLPIGRGVDATAFDDGNAFASCGDGTVTVIRETSPGTFAVVQTIKTPTGARTMCVDSQTHKLYLPTAEFPTPAPAQGRPTPKPDSFMIVVAEPAKSN